MLSGAFQAGAYGRLRGEQDDSSYHSASDPRSTRGDELAADSGRQVLVF